MTHQDKIFKKKKLKNLNFQMSKIKLKIVKRKYFENYITSKKFGKNFKLK